MRFASTCVRVNSSATSPNSGTALAAFRCAIGSARSAQQLLGLCAGLLGRQPAVLPDRDAPRPPSLPVLNHVDLLAGQEGCDAEACSSQRNSRRHRVSGKRSGKQFAIYSQASKESKRKERTQWILQNDVNRNHINHLKSQAVGLLIESLPGRQDLVNYIIG